MRLRGFHYLLTTHSKMYPQPTPHDKVLTTTAVPKRTVATRRAETKYITRTTAKAAAPPQSDSDYESSEDNPNVGTMALPVVEKKVADKGWWA
jgi:hypothetical protein